MKTKMDGTVRRYVSGSLRAGLFILIVGMGVAAAGDTHTWKGGIGSWDDETQWTNGVPLADGDVIIAKGTVTLASASADLASFEMKGGVLVFTGLEARVSALEVAITNGTVTHVANSAIATNIDGTWDVDGRVYFSCSNFTLKAPGIVNADMRGYRSVGTWAKGYGPGGGGGGVSSGSKGAGGGGHGSAGIRADGGGLGGAVNGDAWNPGPGSAGGSGSSAGGFGGGQVRIEASNGLVTLNGTITANGGNAAGRGGGGSGGGVYIGCRVLAGSNGLVQANAGELSSNGGPGGSGRIAIVYDPAAQSAAPKHRVRFSAKRAPTPNSTYGYSDIGTLAIPDQSLFDGAWIPHTGSLISPSFSSWTVETLAVINGWLRFPVPPSTFALTVTNTLSIAGSEGRLQISRPEIQCGVLSLTSSASLYLYPKATNGAIDGLDYGGIVIVSNALSLATNCWIYPSAVSTNGGGILFRVGSMDVASNAGFNANGLGFMRAWRDTNTYAAYGPGKGASVNGSGSGAGHGGRGGRALDTATRGVVYDDPLRPAIPGSGGGTKNNNASAGGMGGGLVRIESYGLVRMDGTLSADGQDGQNYGGGGSGGGIFVKCGAFSGAASGRLSAEGGSRDQTGDGGGGGGRIAVWYGPWTSGEITAERLVNYGTNAPASFSGLFNVLPGAGYTNDAESGTMCFVEVLRQGASGCLILIR
jgi:hypothetical protein